MPESAAAISLRMEIMAAFSNVWCVWTLHCSLSVLLFGIKCLPGRPHASLVLQLAQLPCRPRLRSRSQPSLLKEARLTISSHSFHRSRSRAAQQMMKVTGRTSRHSQRITSHLYLSSKVTALKCHLLFVQVSSLLETYIQTNALLVLFSLRQQSLA